MRASAEKISNRLLSGLAGFSAFVFTLLGFRLLSGLDEQVAASILIGLFALLVVWAAAEKPNSGHARAVAALIDRLLAVEAGDLASPAPAALRKEMPGLAAAVDGLFEQVRSTLDDVHALALYDPVTSLPNRIHFKREADRALKARKESDKGALLFIDLDGFKAVNDRLGHAQGDQVLTMVANRLRIIVKAESDPGSRPMVARLGGDEFTILLPAADGGEEALRIASRALAALSEPFQAGGHSIAMGASIGVALCPNHGCDLATLMKAADVAMYDAKAKGRSRVSLYDAALAEASAEKAETEKALAQALAEKRFELAFQPQICARTCAVVGGEALIRWNHPSGEQRLPESFIPIAEEGSLILDIGEWVMDEAAAALGRWRALGLDQRMAINVSPRQLERSDFFARLREALGRSGTPPWLIELEFTETMVMQCDEAMIAELKSLRADGVSIAIDDFGAGYSNLARMKEVPLDRVKLDKSLIAEIDSSDSARTIVSAVIHLIHGLGYEAVAEGVEREEQLEVLRAIGCDTIQGYSFARPMSEDEFVSWVLDRQRAEARAS